MRRDLIALPDDSKVWIYQADRKIDEASASEIKNYLYDFSMQWESHGRPLDCYGHLFHNRFLAFVTDESNHPSGCSIDSSVRFVKGVGEKYGIDFFDRLQIAYLKDDEVEVVHKSDFQSAFEEGKINSDTLMFNNLVKTKKAFLEDWIVPLSDSWYMKWLT